MVDLGTSEVAAQYPRRINGCYLITQMESEDNGGGVVVVVVVKCRYGAPTGGSRDRYGGCEDPSVPPPRPSASRQRKWV